MQEIMLGMEQPKFRAKQLYQALQNGKGFEDKINVPASLIEKIKESGFMLQPIKIVKKIINCSFKCIIISTFQKSVLSLQTNCIFTLFL